MTRSRPRQWVALFGGRAWIFRDARLTETGNQELTEAVIAETKEMGFTHYETWRRRRPGEAAENAAAVETRVKAERSSQTSAKPEGAGHG